MARASCDRCNRLELHCICSFVAPVFNSTAVTILQYPGEAAHPLNTAALLTQSLKRCQLKVCTATDGQELAPDTVVLFPQPGAAPIDQLPKPPSQLVVIDGTWRKAYRLHAQSPVLASLPHCYLPTSGQGSQYRLRRSDKKGALSTVEAVSQALAWLEPKLDISPLNAAFQQLIARAWQRLPAAVRQHYEE